MGATKRSRTAAAALAAALAQACAAACPNRSEPPLAPEYATALNGVAWPDYCFEQRDLEEHFFIIGDWGGIFRGENRQPETAYSRKNKVIVKGVDDKAQLLVAQQMIQRANVSKPRYLLNVGDNFYWGGVETKCGKHADSLDPSTAAQWKFVFEHVYTGPDLAGKPWLGVLGNHDYGGYMFTKGWDQAIAYTWGPSDRWVTPGQYWSTKVHYSDFSVDLIFVDSNMNDAFPPFQAQGHNICSERNNPVNATCGATGPTSTEKCHDWFHALWQEQIPWMEALLAASSADWRVVTTHFPPDFRRQFWADLADTYAVDLIVTGHRHQQELYDRDPQLGNAAWVVSGGGGGITSEGIPREDGQDDMYGFMDVTISKSAMKIEAISHSGVIRKTVVLTPRRSESTTTATHTATAVKTTTRTTTTTTTTTVATTTTGSATATAAAAPAPTRPFLNHDLRPGDATMSGSGRGHPLRSGVVGAAVVFAAGMIYQ